MFMYVIVKLNIIYMSYLYNIYSASIYVTYIYFGERMVINNTYDEVCDQIGYLNYTKIPLHY